MQSFPESHTDAKGGIGMLPARGASTGFFCVLCCFALSVSLFLFASFPAIVLIDPVLFIPSTGLDISSFVLFFNSQALGSQHAHSTSPSLTRSLASRPTPTPGQHKDRNAFPPVPLSVWRSCSPDLRLCLPPCPCMWLGVLCLFTGAGPQFTHLLAHHGWSDSLPSQFNGHFPE